VQGDIEVNPQKIARWAGLGVVGLVGLYSLTDSFYSVPQTELCYVTQFKQVINQSAGPVGPGLHFKMPWIQDVDCLQVSRSTDNLGTVRITTRDTFSLDLTVGVTTEIPPQSVYRLLYQTGRQGSGDITANINPNIINTLRNIMGKHDLMSIAGENRERVMGEFQNSVTNMLEHDWGIDVREVQVSIAGLPPEFIQRMNAAQSAQAAIVLAQRQQEQSKIDAETAVITARGEANRLAATADGTRRQRETLAAGEAEATRLKAIADSEATRLNGVAMAEAATRMAEAISKNPALVQLEQARRWNGALPQNLYGSAPIPMMQLPTPR
jgi:regulator of protease activity HflC (stomatin/prohibitin superfamily)